MWLLNGDTGPLLCYYLLMRYNILERKRREVKENERNGECDNNR